MEKMNILIKKIPFKLLTIAFYLTFYSCSFLYKKCDHCNLTYQGEEIVYSNSNQISYHKMCYDNYFFPDIEQKKTNKIVKNSSIAKSYFQEVKDLLSKTGLEITDNIELNLADAKDFQVRKG